jgi:hypothetical protein
MFCVELELQYLFAVINIVFWFFYQSRSL